MRLKYESPDIEIVKFSLKTSVLAASGDDPENSIVDNPTQQKPTVPGMDFDFFAENPFS